jgi:beta-lactamase regulating signal transducer with metallopeptidase domain
MGYLNELLPVNFATALSHTLVHSLWQGVILAVITAAILAFTRRLTAARRYQLMIVSLMLFALTAIGTFIWEINQTTSSINTVAVFDQQNTVQQVPLSPIINIKQVSLIDTGINYINAHTQVITLIWFLAVLARSLQLLTGLQGLYHLRRKAVFNVDGYWETRVTELAHKLGIKQIIGIAESGIAKVPMVIGHLKPLILIPVGLLTALPPVEIEAILVHELAHIRRRDYLVNLLQSLVEIIFFFNPAVLWLSALIRTERENCCDDIAVTQTSSKVNYIRALVSCQEYQLSAPAYAMAFPGKRDQLVDRVKRMASGSNHTLNVRERSLLAVILLSAGFMTLAFTNAVKIDHLLSRAGMPVSHNISKAKKGLSPLNDAIAAHSAFKNYETAVKTKTTTDTATDTTATIDTPFKVKPLSAIKGNMGTLQGKLEQQKVPDSTNQSQLTALKPMVSRLSTVANGPYAKPYQAGYSTYPGSKKQADNSYGKDYKPEYPTSQPAKEPTIDDRGDRVTAELIKDGLVDGTAKKLSFKLSEKELIVNGVRQPDGVFLRYKDKFVPVTGKNGWTLYHNFETDQKVTDKP